MTFLRTQGVSLKWGTIAVLLSGCVPAGVATYCNTTCAPIQPVLNCYVIQPGYVLQQDKYDPNFRPCPPKPVQVAPDDVEPGEGDGDPDGDPDGDGDGDGDDTEAQGSQAHAGGGAIATEGNETSQTQAGSGASATIDVDPDDPDVEPESSHTGIGQGATASEGGFTIGTGIRRQ